MKKLLPIGSVVMLKGGKKRVMIIGRIQRLVNTDKLYDYSACYYPEGVLDPKDLFLFNNEDIDTVYFVGFQDTEEFKFRGYLEDEIGKIVKEE